MIFSIKGKEDFDRFYHLIEENIGVFTNVMKSKLESQGNPLSDEDFTSGYVEGMEKVINCLHKWAFNELKGDSEAINRYEDAIENPSKSGFRFPNEEMTIGKIYLFYIWGKTKKKASKSDCIKLERFAFSLIGKECMELGIVK